MTPNADDLYMAGVRLYAYWPTAYIYWRLSDIPQTLYLFLFSSDQFWFYGSAEDTLYSINDNRQWPHEMPPNSTEITRKSLALLLEPI